MNTITEKMNAIEMQTRELLEKAQFLEDQKNMMSNLMECSVNDHQWLLRNVTSTLTEVYQMDLYCERCGATANFPSMEGMQPIPIFSTHEQRLSALVGEEE